MKSILIQLCLITFSTAVSAQKIDDIIHSIEQNSPMIEARQNMAEAEKKEAKTGIYLQNPEIEFHYLWGKPSDTEDNRLDLNVTQDFDFPSAYKRRRKMAEQSAQLADIQFLQQRQAILHEAALVCIELAYNNSLADILDEQIVHVRHTAEATQKSFEAGHTSIIENSQMQLMLIDMQSEIDDNAIERIRLQKELTRLNGNKDIEYSTRIEEIPLIADADISKSVEIKEASQNIALANANMAVKRSERLPHFSVGYVSERSGENSLQGFSIAMSIPICENKGTTKAAQAMIKAAELEENETQLRIKNLLESEILRFKSKCNACEKIKKAIDEFTIESTCKALENNEISIDEYIQDIESYFNMRKKYIEALRSTAECAENINAIGR